jgi:hypothetical protein
LGGYDGVSIEAARWQRAFREMGWSVTRAAGFFADTADTLASDDDVTVSGLWAPAEGARPPAHDPRQISDLCRAHDLLILDNVGSLPTAPETAIALEREALRIGVPTIVRHHDPPWQVTRSVGHSGGGLPLHDPHMLHVTINRLTESEFRPRYPDLDRANAVTTIYNTVDRAVLGGGNRWVTRRQRGIGEDHLLLVHPARFIARKNIPAALQVAEQISRRTGRTIHYWLTDPIGDIGPAPVGVVVHRGHAPCPADLYAAADFVVLTSTWEGWGLPVIEAAAAKRPTITFPYPVLAEINQLGIQTVDHTDIEQIIGLLDDPSRYQTLAAANHRHTALLDVDGLPAALQRAVDRATALMTDMGSAAPRR